MKRLLLVSLTVLVLLSTLVAGACSKKSSKYVIATDATYPPFENVDSQGNLEGFDIDLMNAIAEKADIDFEFVNVGFDSLLAGMGQGTYDAAISSITITPARAASMLFSDPYYVAGQMIIVQNNNTNITGADSLKGKKIGVQLGTTGEALAKDISGATVKSYNQIGLAIQDLLNGQTDAVICDTPIADNYVKVNSGKLKIIGDALTTEDYGIAVAKGNEALLAKINQGLAAVKAAGTIDTLVAKWVAK